MSASLTRLAKPRGILRVLGQPDCTTSIRPEARTSWLYHRQRLVYDVLQGQRRTYQHAAGLGIVHARSGSDGIDELVSAIPPFVSGRSSQVAATTAGSTSLLVLLLTSRYARDALSGDIPTRLIRRLGDNPTVSQPLDTVVAVVDRLPHPEAPQTGIQGLGYAFMQAGPSLDAAVPRHSSTAQPGSLTWILPPGEDGAQAAVQVPLACTIFSTGLPSTLVRARYHFDPLSGLLRKSALENVESQAVPIPCNLSYTQMTVRLPLIPLTPMRTVTKSMGNIVRELSMGSMEGRQPEAEGQSMDCTSRKDASMPASQELERAVSSYFHITDTPPEPVQVWALISPKHTHPHLKNSKLLVNDLRTSSHSQIQERWRQGPRGVVGGAVLHESFKHGFRLRKVLSGGGGWGKKAGLLSLDPNSDYHIGDSFTQEGSDILFDDTVPQQQNALGDIVAPGDDVMFLLAPKNFELDLASYGSRHPLGSKTSDITFGVLPSSIDVLPEGDQKGPNQTTLSGTRNGHYANMFGMLSEGGMALRLAESSKLITQTKVDVPFASFTLRD